MVVIVGGLLKDSYSDEVNQGVCFEQRADPNSSPPHKPQRNGISGATELSRKGPIEKIW